MVQRRCYNESVLSGKADCNDMKIAYLIAKNGRILAVSGAKAFVVWQDHADYDIIKDAVLTNDLARLESLVPAVSVEEAFKVILSGKGDFKNTGEVNASLRR